MEFAIYASLMSLAIGLFTSMSFLSLTHIFIALPAIYFLPRTNFRRHSKSTWLLIVLVLLMTLSVFLNQDIATNGLKPILKTKYYIIAIFSIVPFTYYFRVCDEKKSRMITYLLWGILVTTTIANLSGVMGVLTGFNILKWRTVITGRNSGLAGMVLNYAHNLALLQILITGMLFYRNEVKKHINIPFLFTVWSFNLLALVMTYTRGAILAFLVALPFYFYRNNKKVFVIIASSLIIVSAVIYKILGQLILRPLSDIERLSQWKAALYAFQERPFWGYGFLNFEPHSVPIKIKYGIEAIHFGGHAHNNFLEILASCGIFAFIAFCGWIVMWFLEMGRRDDLLAKLGSPFIIAFVVSGLTQATFNLGANLFLIMSFYALTQMNNQLLKEKDLS